MNITWTSQIDTWNAMVQAGQGQAVARELKRVPRGELSPALLAKVANLAWRVNRPEIGLRLLFAEIRLRGHLKTHSHPDVFTEYAGCLLEVGALLEAKRILNEVQHSAPRAKFYLALLLFKEWDYEPATALLEKYLTEIPEDYHHQVVRVNLASAFVATKQWTRAMEVLSTLKPALEKDNRWLLLGNCYEIESQIHFYQKDHVRALSLLEQSDRHLAGMKNMGWLYGQKWQFLNRAYRDRSGGQSAEQKSEFKALRQTAVQMNSWETVRELDLHQALLSRDEKLLHHVYFGSPAVKYRERVLELAADQGFTHEIPESYVWLPSAEPGASPQIVDLAALKAGESDLAPSFLVKKLFLIFTSDFYLSFRVGQAFSALFPGDFFNVETSPDRVFQIVSRLRTLIKEEKMGCSVTSSRHGYRMWFDRDRGVRVTLGPVEHSRIEKNDLNRQVIKTKFGDKAFTSLELSQRLHCSKRSANRVLKDLEERGHVQVLGQGRKTRFKLAV